jgi:hypothetical protein
MPSAMPTAQTIEISVSSAAPTRREASPIRTPAASPKPAAPSVGSKPAR